MISKKRLHYIAPLAAGIISLSPYLSRTLRQGHTLQASNSTLESHVVSTSLPQNSTPNYLELLGCGFIMLSLSSYLRKKDRKKD